MAKSSWKGLSLGGLLLVAACAAPPPPAPPPAPPPPPPPPPMVMPTPPNSAATNLVIPITDMTGRRMTPNVDLSPEQALWHLRIALNVAALSCRGPNEQVLVNNYSTFLRNHQRAIAAAERWVIADQGRRNGTNGIAARDALSTRLYNYFAQPPVKTAFCTRAESIAALAALEPAANILPFSTVQIVQADQPFVDFYSAYAQYQADYARWRAMQPAPTIAATPPAGTSLSTAPGAVRPANVAPSVLPGVATPANSAPAGPVAGPPATPAPTTTPTAAAPR